MSALPLWVTLEIVTNIFFKKEREQNSYFFQAEKMRYRFDLLLK